MQILVLLYRQDCHKTIHTRLIDHSNKLVRTVLL